MFKRETASSTNVTGQAKQSSNNFMLCVYLSRSSVEAFAPLEAEGRGGVLDVVEGATRDGGLIGVLRGHDGQQVRDVGVQHDVHGLGRTQQFKQKCKLKNYIFRDNIPQATCVSEVETWRSRTMPVCPAEGKRKFRLYLKICQKKRRCIIDLIPA